jgi:Helix-turn-helix domain
VTVGETLTGARNQAGLSVEELSERTQIRGTVIRSIEQDDYEACGGDLYVRGYVRAIAGAVGLDAQPLIDEYDLARVAQPYERPNGWAGRHAQALPRAFAEPLPADATMFDLPPVSEDPAATRYDLPPVPAEAADPDATRYDLPPVTGDFPGYAPRPLAAPADAGAATSIIPAFGPGPASPFAPPPYAGPGPSGGLAGRRKRRTLIGAAAVVVVLAAAGGIGIALTSGGGTTAIAPTANSKSTAASSGATAKASAPGASATAGQGGNAAASGAAVTNLPVASVTAFGPAGTGDGDNAGSAEDAVSSKATSPWSTQWYATAKFGQLKSGTGLLLDLGGTATVTSVRMDLSQNRGATVQLQVGSSTKDLKVAATAKNAGGPLQLTLKHPATGQYLLIWFTQLPPDGAGHYAETVSGVKVKGQQ